MKDILRIKWLINVMLAIVFLTGSSEAKILIQDKFDRGTEQVPEPLKGSAPSVSALDKARWLASKCITNGSAALMTAKESQRALIPFVPQQGKIYELSATVTMLEGDNDWMGLGFAHGTGVVNQVRPGIIIRKKGAVHGMANGKGTLLTGGAGSSVKLAVILDTRGGKWTASWSINDSMTGVPVELNDTKVSAVGMSVFGKAGGTFSNFCLRELASLPDTGAAGDEGPSGTVFEEQLNIISLGANLALAKPYECDDPSETGWNLGLTDGSWVTARGTTFATGTTNTFPKTVTINLKRSAKITHVRVGVPSFGATKTVAVSVSYDGKIFSNIGSHDFSAGRAEGFWYKCDPILARYVRLSYEGNHPKRDQYSNAISFTTEVEVYAQPK